MVGFCPFSGVAVCWVGLVSYGGGGDAVQLPCFALFIFGGQLGGNSGLTYLLVQMRSRDTMLIATESRTCCSMKSLRNEKDAKPGMCEYIKPRWTTCDAYGVAARLLSDTSAT